MPTLDLPTSDAELRAMAEGLPEVAVTPEAAGALDLVASGTVSPATEVKLPLPRGCSPAVGDVLAVRDLEGVLIAVVRARTVMTGTLTADVLGARRPDRPDYPDLWRSPQAARAVAHERGWPEPVPALVAELPPTPEAFAGALTEAGGKLLVLALASGAPDDPAHHTKVRAWRQLVAPHGDAVLLVLVPAALPTDPAAAEKLRAQLAGNYAARPVTAPEEVDTDAALPHRSGGATVLLTGLSGSGKSTIAGRLLVHLLEAGRTASLLDGDVVRTHLSKGLGFSKEDRDTNVRRIGFVAAEITKHGGVAIAAPIAPYAATRRAVRAMVERYGEFVLVHVATPLEVCEQRDRKGLYAKARAGEIPEFTGVSDPYEEPDDADIVIDTETTSADDAAELIVAHLRRVGALAATEPTP